jgi:hypothetical protein
MPLTPQQEALILAEERDRRAFSRLEDRLFRAADSKHAQRIRAESAAESMRKYGCTF